MRFSPSNNNYGNAGTKLGVSSPSLVSKTIGKNGVVSNAEHRLTVLVILTHLHSVHLLSFLAFMSNLRNSSMRY